MRPATAVFWSPRYSDGFKHVACILLLLAVPMQRRTRQSRSKKCLDTLHILRGFHQKFEISSCPHDVYFETSKRCMPFITGHVEVLKGS